MLSATFSSGAGELPGSIKTFIDNKEEGSYYKIDNEYLLSGNVLPLFYVNRNYAPAWFNQNNLSNNGYVLLDYIRQVDQQGLQPEDYHLYLIEAYIGKILCFFKTDGFNRNDENGYFAYRCFFVIGLASVLW